MKKYRIVILVISMIQITYISSQNLLNYAISSNGAKGECLFPEDASGNVVFSNIINFPCSADSIMQIVDGFLMSKQLSDRCNIKCVSKNNNTSIYDVKINVGKQIWGIEYWGTPVFASIRDASHVKFKCIIEPRNGKFKYSFINFETNRRTIRGGAKNDGQPNIIHWQRINTLTKERNTLASTHDTNKREVKEELFDFNSQIIYEACLYQAEYDAVENFENGLKNLKIEDEFLDFSNSISDSEKTLNNTSQGRHFSFSIFGDGFFNTGGNNQTHDKVKHNDSNYYNYKGFLLEKGNNVYITANGSLYEQAGAQELSKQVLIDGFWNLVDNVQDAHFVIQYYVNLEGRDMAYVAFTTPKGDYGEVIGIYRASESANENRDVARKIYLNKILPLFKKIEAKKIPKQLAKFTKE